MRSQEPCAAAAPRPNALLVCQRSFLARVEQTPAFPGLFERHQRLWKTFCVLSGRKQGAPPASALTLNLVMFLLAGAGLADALWF